VAFPLATGPDAARFLRAPCRVLSPLRFACSPLRRGFLLSSSPSLFPWPFELVGSTFALAAADLLAGHPGCRLGNRLAILPGNHPGCRLAILLGCHLPNHLRNRLASLLRNLPNLAARPFPFRR